MFQVIEESKWADRLRRAGARDMSALAALYDETSVSVFSLILRIVQDRQSAEDILLDLYRQVGQQACNHGKRGQPSLPSLLMLARNLAVDRLRRSSLQPEPPQFYENLAFDQLTDEQRSIIQMTYFGGLSARQAGVRLGLSPQYVTQQICLALKKLRMTIDGRKERPRWPFVERVGNILFFPKPYSKV